MNSADSIFPHLAASVADSSALIRRVFGEPHFRTEGEVVDLAFAPDGTLWSMEESGALRQWGAEGHPLQRFFLSDLEMIWEFGPGAQLIASGSSDLAVWDVPTGSLLRRLAQPSWVTALAFTADGRTLASGHDDGTVRLWEAESLKLLAEFPAHPPRPAFPSEGNAPPGGVSTLAFHPDGTRLASAGEDRAIHVWDVGTRARTAALMGHPDRIPALAWHPREGWLASAGWDTSARVWEPPNPEPLMLLNSHSEQVVALAFSPDGRFLACADSDNAVHVWGDPRGGKVLHVLQGHLSEVRCVTFSPDGKRLATADADGMIHIWDAEEGRLLAGRESPNRNLITVLPGAQPRLASTALATLSVWDAATGEKVPAPDAGETLAAAASPDGRWLATSGPGPDMIIWDARTAERKYVCPHTRGPISYLTFAPDSRRVASASASDGLVWLWELGAPEAVLVIPEAADSCTLEALAFHPGGRLLAVGGLDWLATGGSDGAVCVWDVEARDRVALLTGGVTSLAFNPAGNLLAGGALRGTVLLWEMPSGKPLQELGSHLEQVTAVAFTPDGRHLLAAGLDRTIRVWETATLRPVVTRQFDTPVQSLAFSPDGRLLFTGNANTTCYEIEVSRLVEE